MAQRGGDERPVAGRGDRGPGTSAVKPRWTSHVFLAKLRQDKRLNNHVGEFIPRGTGSDGGVARDPDGRGLGGTAAHRQFRLGRYHLDVFGRPGRRGQRACGRWKGRAPTARQWLVAALVAAWSLRLGAAYRGTDGRHIGRSALCGVRAGMGRRAPRRMFLFLQNQALGSIPLVFAIFVAARISRARACGAQDYLGALVLLVGIAGEALADAQLKQFSERSGATWSGLRCRSVALVAASELFLRMAGLARLSRDRDLAGSPRLSLGLGRRCWRPLSCTGSWCTSPASRRWKRKCCARAASAIATTSRAPASSFRCRRAKGEAK